MSYTVLARKWRPRVFKELVGQMHVVKALVNALSAERLHHAYLFAGTRGVGKTTLARILSKALNCKEGVVAEPCGKCNACIGIDEGRFVDLLEVDAASRTKVDDTRELLDNVQYRPTEGRFKIYLIDEVHMLSKHSFNALLKTLEEPPPHIKFLLATTDPQKLPATVLSRCLQFNLKRLSVKEIFDQLNKICTEESVSSDADALFAVAKSAEGSMRDALSLLDQAIAFGGGTVTLDSVSSMLGSIDVGHARSLVSGLIERDGSILMNEVARIDEQAPDYELILDDLMGLFQELAVVQLVGTSHKDEVDEELCSFASRLSPEDVQLYYQIALNGRRDLGYCRDFRSAFEMVLLRMLAFSPRISGASIDESDANNSSGKKSNSDREIKPSTELTNTKKQSTIAKPDGQAQTPKLQKENWTNLLKKLDIRGASRQLAEHCMLRKITDNQIHLILASENAHLNTDQIRSRLEAAFSQYQGKKVVVLIEISKTLEGTPAQVRSAGEDERMRSAREDIEGDPKVQEVQKEFDAILEVDSIQLNNDESVEQRR
tara:strand:+ start:5473 stop:7110 length:1638 start_codon:yes stop_codon:yes gene_type:complete